MRTETDCIECFRQQVRKMTALLDCDSELAGQIQSEVADLLASLPDDYSPPETARAVYQHLTHRTGVLDPYLEIKEKSTQMVLAHYEQIKDRVTQAEDPLRQAILLAGLGNIIDYGAHPDMQLDIASLLAGDIELGIFDYDAFKQHLAAAEHILILADNAGETVFDRLLIETLGKPVTYAVKSYPIINDTLEADAVAAGIPQVAEIMQTGTGCAGDVLRTCSPAFNRAFEQADMVISKGQGNFEALTDVKRPVFFILKVKCELIARHIGTPIGSLILKGLNA